MLCTAPPQETWFSPACMMGTFCAFLSHARALISSANMQKSLLCTGAAQVAGGGRGAFGGLQGPSPASALSQLSASSSRTMSGLLRGGRRLLVSAAATAPGPGAIAGLRASFAAPSASTIPPRFVSGLASDPQPCAPAPDLVGQIQDSTLLKTQCYVGGQWIEAADGRQLEVRNPAAGPPCRCCRCSLLSPEHPA
jgi:hypothetical protein